MEALTYIKSLHPSPFTHRCVTQNEEIDTNERNLKVNIKAIHQEIFNPKRHRELSVVVVDYNMPAMNGLELCERLAGVPHIKKLMLTGEADNTIAVEAFNNGLIDKFIKKDSNSTLSLNQSLYNAVYELQLQYFNELSKPIMDSLRNSPEKMADCFSDPEFTTWFYGFLKQHKFIEFYLIENQANFLLSTRHGKLSCLAIRSRKEMNHIAQFIIDMIDGQPSATESKLIDTINAYKAIPFFYSEDDYQSPVQDWEKYMHPCAELTTKQNTYYYSLIEGNPFSSIDASKIKSFSACQAE
jgi:CheY-like chemotaxis protein